MREYEFAGMMVERFAGYHRQSYGGCKVELMSLSSNSPPSMFERSADLSFPSSLLILK